MRKIIFNDAWMRLQELQMIIVVDSHSTDKRFKIAEAAGAKVIFHPCKDILNKELRYNQAYYPHIFHLMQMNCPIRNC